MTSGSVMLTLQEMRTDGKQTRHSLGWRDGWPATVARLALAGVGIWVLTLASTARQAVPDVRRALLDLPVGAQMLARDLSPLQGGGGPLAFRFADAVGDPALAGAREARLGLLVAAVVAAEDSRFFEHRGIDPVAMARAGWANGPV